MEKRKRYCRHFQRNLIQEVAAAEYSSNPMRSKITGRQQHIIISTVEYNQWRIQQIFTLDGENEYTATVNSCIMSL